MERLHSPPACLSAVQAFLQRAKEDSTPPPRLETGGEGPTITLELGLGVFDVGCWETLPKDLKENSGVLMPEILDKPRKRKKRKRMVVEVGQEELDRKLTILREIRAKYPSRFTRNGGRDKTVARHIEDT